MELKEIIKSEIDKTIKYIFEINKQVIEFSYIDNGTGKDIICVPCQTMCNMSCTFCHLTDYVGKIPLKDLSRHEIIEGVEHIINDLGLGNRTILISYMGCGEPMDNIGAVHGSMVELDNDYDNIRFGMATMLPKSRWEEFFKLAKWIKDGKINLKVHLSLHFNSDELRKKWMPAALEIKPSIDALNFYKSLTGNDIEVHYTIMDGINDSDEDMYSLEMSLNAGTTIKFMMFSEKENLDAKRTSKARINEIKNYLVGTGHTVEYYEPPGNDIGASCGQFLTNFQEEEKNYTID